MPEEILDEKYTYFGEVEEGDKILFTQRDEGMPISVGMVYETDIEVESRDERVHKVYFDRWWYVDVYEFAAIVSRGHEINNGD